MIQVTGWLLRSASGLRVATSKIPPTGLVLLSIVSTQLGAAIAKSLFEQLGPVDTVFLRVFFAAIVLLCLWRPQFGSYTGNNYFIATLFGLVLAGMNLSFYCALQRLPLGIAVTIEFVGPLGVAVVASRRLLDLLWVTLAAVGILLLAPIGGGKLDPVGVLLAILAGSFWAAYIFLSARAGSVFPGGTGLAIAMSVAAILLLPVAVLNGGAALLNPRLLTAGLGVALLSSALPYSLELTALRHLSARVFGVLLSLESTVAALVGFLILGEKLELRAIIAILLITVATVGVSRNRGGRV